MEMNLQNFGGFLGTANRTFDSKTLPNGEGKTTLINAYIFTLSGKTINGFTPRNTFADDTQRTSVTLTGFNTFPPLRRVLKDSGTTLYIGEDVATQTDFESILKQRGYDLEFILACANANVLTSNGLDAETLRSILVKADVLDNGERDVIKKKKVETSKKLDIAKQYALTNVVVPTHKLEPLTEAEQVFLTTFKLNKAIVNDGVVEACPHCKRAYDRMAIDSLTITYNEAVDHVRVRSNEFARIISKQVDYETETQEIEDAKRLLAGATKARQDMITLTKELADVEAKLRELDNQTTAAHLPDGVTVVTEILQKNGTTKPTCTLEHLGVPLRSINHARRIEICVKILDKARTEKGMLDVPIVIDNAEAVEHDFAWIKNVILFKAKRKNKELPDFTSDESLNCPHFEECKNGGKNKFCSLKTFEDVDCFMVGA